MREISLETQEILKSQKMLGANKFNYELKLEGVEEGVGGVVYDKNSILINNNSSSTIDIVVRTDGKILVAYKKDNKIFVSHVDNEAILLDDPYDILAYNEILVYQLTASISAHNFSLLRLNNGSILLFVSDLGALDGTDYKTMVFKSQNGLGNDFVQTSILSTHKRLYIGNIKISDTVGKASYDDDGNILIAYMGMSQDSGVDISILHVSKSSDNGDTWEKIYTFSTFANLGVWADRAAGVANISQIISIGDILFFTYYSTYSINQSLIVYSLDKGITWTSPQYNNDGILPNLLPLSDLNNSRLITQDINRKNLFYFRYTNDGGNAIFRLYTMPKEMVANIVTLDDINNWSILYEKSQYIPTMVYAFNLVHTAINNLFIIHRYNQKTYSLGIEREIYSAPIKASSISISKGRGGANSLSLSIDNSNGAVNPFNPQNPLYGIVGLNKQIIVKQGYGQDLIETFTGRIDTFNMKSFPHTMEIQCRDNLKKALDQTITESGKNTVFFESQPIENIFGYLCYLAGIETGEIEETGINISKEFSWQSYADAFQFLADLASFEYGADEYGKVYFRRDFQPDEIEIAYTFEEGIDITSLSYELSDKDLYSVVKVYGKSGDNVISYSAPFPDAAKYNILPQKILKVDATEAATINELKKIADRSIYLMNSRTAVVNFNAIAVPWLQVGDFIQVNETSSMSAGIYRISSLNLKMDNSNFVMDLQCYYYGDSVEIGTLPEDTATQTPNAELNLIPEMTSNTAPAGVARASSVLKLYENDYQPWNALNSTSDDLYWNAVSPYGWIEYQFTEKTIIDKYTLKARQAIDYNRAMPKNFTFEGFDGEKWIVLDTRSNQTAWGIHEVRSYEFNNTVAYSKYRLNVTANNGFHRLQLEQLGMFYRGGV